MSFTCPRCNMTSHNPHDEEEGYCGNCKTWTAPPWGIVWPFVAKSESLREKDEP